MYITECCFLFCQVSIPALERTLKEYTQGAASEPFDMKSVPLAAVPSQEDREVKHKSEGMLISQVHIRILLLFTTQEFYI